MTDTEGDEYDWPEPEPERVYPTGMLWLLFDIPIFSIFEIVVLNPALSPRTYVGMFVALLLYILFLQRYSDVIEDVFVELWPDRLS